MIFSGTPNSLDLRLKRAKEEGSSPPSLANLLEEGFPIPSIRKTTTKSYSFWLNETLPCHIVTDNLFIHSETFTRQLLSRSYEKSKFLILLWSNVNWFLRTGGRTRKEAVCWGDLPVEFVGEIGKQLTSRLDILRFRSVCNKWRLSLPPPTRFPLWVPLPPNLDPKSFTEVSPPNMDDPDPYSPLFKTAEPRCIITECNIYRCRGVYGVMKLEEVSRPGNFHADQMRYDASHADRVNVAKLGRPRTVSLMGRSWGHPFRRMRFAAKSHYLRMAVPRWEPSMLRTVIHGEWSRFYTLCGIKVVLVSGSYRVNPIYAKESDLIAVALLKEGKMDGRLALLRLEGPSKDWAWDTDFCHLVFEDISLYRGRLCTLDASGTVFLMDNNSLKMTRVSPPWDSDIRYTFECIEL